MRRLLIAMALVAAALAVPSAALAATAPVLTVTAAVTNLAPSLHWNDVRAIPTDPMAYQVFRGSAPCASSPTFAPIGAVLSADTLAFDDSPRPVDGTYCYYVQADDGVPAPSNQVDVKVDATGPAITVVKTGGTGCGTEFSFTAATTDSSPPVALTVAGAPYVANTKFPADGSPPLGNPFDSVNPTVVATDSVGNVSQTSVPGVVLDPTRPTAPTGFQISTEPAQQKATLTWASIPPDGAPVVSWHLHTKGPLGTTDVSLPLDPRSLTVGNLQVDATYEYTLSAFDTCGEGAKAVSLVRLNDTTPPTAPIVTGPAFDPAARTVSFQWVASTDNIQVDHYEILRNGVPVGATDAPTFTDASPGQHAQLSYVVRAVDTNGNDTDSAPATVFTPDWTPPTAPVLTVTRQGTATALLRWSAGSDNVGVVGYDVLRDGTLVKSMTSAERTWSDSGVKVGDHAWEVRARDAAGLSAVSAPQHLKIAKSVNKAALVAVHLAGKSKRAAHYSLAGRARLLVDVRIVGTLQKAKLRLYVKSGRGRITVWRGTPGSSSPRLRLGSALARHGYVTISLKRALHTGRVRLVLIASGHLVVVGSGAHKPTMKAG